MYWTRFEARSSVSRKTMFGWLGGGSGSFRSGGALTATRGSLGGDRRAVAQPAIATAASAAIAAAAARVAPARVDLRPSIGTSPLCKIGQFREVRKAAARLSAAGRGRAPGA